MATIAIAAPHPAGIEAARQMAAEGGGVVDAALAAAAALTVAYPHQCSIGGDLVALVRDGARGIVRAVVSAGAAAAAADPAPLRAAGDRMPAGGPHTVTVPGVVAGWAELARLGARLPLARALAPARALAEDGVAVSAGLARAIRNRLDVVRADPGLSALLLDKAGEPLPAGATLLQPALAATLAELSEDWRHFYTGPTARRLVAVLRARGSLLDMADFAAHRAENTTPLSTTRDGVTWWVAPPPSQGAALLAVLGRKSDPLTAARQAELSRDALLGDPRSGGIDIDGLLLREQRDTAALPSGPKPSGDTVAVTAVDDEGNAVTLIQSVFQSFGSGIAHPATGVVLHNRGSAFSLDPAHPGALRPGARPPHTLCPALATGPGRVVALGCQGGRAQAWILSQVADALLDAPDPEALLARPRWVIGSRDLNRPGPTLVLEPGVPDSDGLIAVADGLGLAVAEVPGPHDEAGHVQMARLRGGVLDAASDPRADGTAVVLTGAAP
ncbi:gamma-glutamyltransferase [Streptomyces scopuliridis]|uniref:Gamma-glutamyltransferase n=1 Tax=Streptomyces scopuliridis TaxID=452529 RepID=A0ACD4ZC41_9ACTN|nr:gamma-glutamyltransferase [Streptomyces scopuliridis]WSB95713.1 gamma-glutamyltransferase [Streptomyces scopuliridis]WSC10580.1 gamma-glutamyltransferase [Streptomyces scopuliridis]